MLAVKPGCVPGMWQLPGPEGLQWFSSETWLSSWDVAASWP